MNKTGFMLLPENEKSLKLTNPFYNQESIFRTDSVVGTDGPVNYSGSCKLVEYENFIMRCTQKYNKQYD